MERNKPAQALRLIAWGYLFLYLDFHLSRLNLLPDFLCYALILRALPTIGARIPSALLLRPLGLGLGCWEGFLWGMTLLGNAPPLPFVRVLAAVSSLYFHFQLLTNLAQLADQSGCPEGTRLLRLRSVRTIFATLFALPLPWARYEALTMAALFVALALALWLCCVLFSLKKSLESGLPEQ